MSRLIDPTADIHPTATIGDNAEIGPRVTVGPNAVIGRQGPVTIEADTSIGDGARIDYATIRTDVTIGPAAKIGQHGENHRFITIGRHTKIGQAVRVMNGAQISGYVTIGQMASIDDTQISGGATIGTNAILTNSSIGERTTIAPNARLERCNIGFDIKLPPMTLVACYLHDNAVITVDPRDGNGGYALPDHASIPGGCITAQAGDAVVVGLVGSEGYGRWVTIVRQQADNRARVVAGCWKNSNGGSIVQLRDVALDPDTWPASVAARCRAEYLGIVDLARRLERTWARDARLREATAVIVATHDLLNIAACTRETHPPKTTSTATVANIAGLSGVSTRTVRAVLRVASTMGAIWAGGYGPRITGNKVTGWKIAHYQHGPQNDGTAYTAPSKPVPDQDALVTAIYRGCPKPN